MSTSFDYKSLETFLEKVKDILGLTRFSGTIDNAITEQYSTAIERVDADLKLPINLVPKDKDLRILQDYVNKNVQSAGDEISNNIRQEIQRGILNKETIVELANRVKFLFQDKKYQHRLKTIIRTEVSRANNMGTLEAARQATEAGVKLKKWLDVVMDDRTSGVCVEEYKKYGTKEQAIPIDEEFIVKVNNKTVRAQAPPFLPNCRTVLRIVRQ